MVALEPCLLMILGGISISPVISKLFELAVLDRFSNFLRQLITSLALRNIWAAVMLFTP